MDYKEKYLKYKTKYLELRAKYYHPVRRGESKKQYVARIQLIARDRHPRNRQLQRRYVEDVVNLHWREPTITIKMNNNMAKINQDINHFCNKCLDHVKYDKSTLYLRNDKLDFYNRMRNVCRKCGNKIERKRQERPFKPFYKYHSGPKPNRIDLINNGPRNNFYNETMLDGARSRTDMANNRYTNAL